MFKRYGSNPEQAGGLADAYDIGLDKIRQKNIMKVEPSYTAPPIAPSEVGGFIQTKRERALGR